MRSPGRVLCVCVFLIPDKIYGAMLWMLPGIDRSVTEEDVIETIVTMM